MSVTLAPVATATDAVTALGFVGLFYFISVLVTAFLEVPLFSYCLSFGLFVGGLRLQQDAQ